MTKNETYKNPRISEFITAICTQYNLDYNHVKAFLFVNYPELKNKKTCANCGANMKAFWHTVNSGLVGIMIKAITFIRDNGKNEFHLQDDLHLSVNEFSNFTKLRFHGLVAHVKDKSGYWLITKRGGEFLRGEISIPKQVKTFRNRVIDHSPDTVNITRFKHDFPSFESDYAFEIQQGRLI